MRCQGPAASGCPTTTCRCVVQVCSAGVWCRCVVTVCSFDVQCWCAVLVYGVNMRCRCTVSMCGAGVWCWYAVPVCSGVVRCRCAVCRRSRARCVITVSGCAAPPSDNRWEVTIISSKESLDSCAMTFVLSTRHAIQILKRFIVSLSYK